MSPVLVLQDRKEVSSLLFFFNIICLGLLFSLNDVNNYFCILDPVTERRNVQFFKIQPLSELYPLVCWHLYFLPFVMKSSFGQCVPHYYQVRLN